MSEIPLDKQLAAKGFSYLLQFFSDYDYHKLADGIDPARLDYRRLDNLTGHQQRCFAVYWALKGASHGAIGVDMGCGEVIHPCCLGIDKYQGDAHPNYPSPTKANYRPHIVLRADKPLPFTDSCFDFLISLHSLEHMADTVWTLKEWIRIVKPGGILAVVMPDAKYGSPMDKDHKVDYSAEEFKADVLAEVDDLVEVVEFDTFNNHFSFNVVLRKK